ncbi:MAG: hypothetical protein JST75_22270 [Bacteroidetes bacterium]|nr:hypothetical protein [Bacteroidota bacterium]
MIGVFKQKSSINALLLFIYALVLKFPMFLHPVLPVLHKEDNYFYRFILNALDTLFNDTAIFFSIITFFLLFTQATLLNSICNYHRILPKPNYLPGMAYILVTSLLQDWNHFSAPLLVNSVMIWCWYKMVSLYNSHTSIGVVFNIGLFVGMSTLLYMPAIAFLVLLFFALIVMRPFRIQEWFVGLLGFTSPYYFLILILYFSHQLEWKNLIPDITFTLPALPGSIWITLGVALLVIPFIVGGYFVQNNMNKMMIHVRKSWSLLLVFMIAAVGVILINKAGSYENWIVTAMPFATFHAAAYYYPNNKILPRIVHWACFIFILVINYFI